MKPRRKGLKRLVGNEHGKVLILALIFLVLGALLLTPLLGLMSTGLTAGRVHENRAHSLYAADAGVEDGVNWLLEGKPGDWPWTGGDEGPWERSQELEVNHHNVEVTIEVHGLSEANKYKITSASKAINGGGGTKVIALVMVQPRFQGCYLIGDQTFNNQSGTLDGTIIVVGIVTIEHNHDLNADDVFIDGDLHLVNNSKLVLNSGGVRGVICVTGDITLENNTEINADIHFLGDDCTLTILHSAPDAVVNGNIWAEGNLTIRILAGNAKVEMTGDVYAPNGNVSVYLDKGNSELRGDIYAGGEITIDNENRYHFCRYYLDDTSGLWVSDDGCAAREDPPFEIPPCPSLPDSQGTVVDSYQIEGYGD